MILYVYLDEQVVNVPKLINLFKCFQFKSYQSFYFALGLYFETYLNIKIDVVVFFKKEVI